MASQSLGKTLRQLLEQGRLEEIADLASSRKRVLGTLVALTFDSDIRIGWRAIEAMGISAERVSQQNPAYVKEHMRRLYWLITEESGGVFWRAPECMAECGARLPTLLKEFIPIAFHLLETFEEEDLEHFRPGALYSVGRLAELAGDDLERILPLVLDALGDPDPQARGMAVWCLGEIGESKALEGRSELMADDGPVDLYRGREIVRLTVAELTHEVLAGVAQS